MDIKRGKSLYMIFLGYLISFCILSIIWIFSLVAFINISVNKDIIKPANYMENQVEKLKLEAKQGLKFDSSKYLIQVITFFLIIKIKWLKQTLMKMKQRI